MENNRYHYKIDFAKMSENFAKMNKPFDYFRPRSILFVENCLFMIFTHFGNYQKCENTELINLIELTLVKHVPSQLGFIK